MPPKLKALQSIFVNIYWKRFFKLLVVLLLQSLEYEVYAKHFGTDYLVV